MISGPCRGFSRTQVNYPQYIRNFDGPKSFLPTLVDYLSQARKGQKRPGEIFRVPQKRPGYAVPMQKNADLCHNLYIAMLCNIKLDKNL